MVSILNNNTVKILKNFTLASLFVFYYGCSSEDGNQAGVTNSSLIPTGTSTSTTTGTTGSDLPTGPSGYTLEYPANNLSNISSPIIRFTELNVGDIIYLYTDSECLEANKVAEQSAESDTLDIELTLTQEDIYKFYAVKYDANLGLTACSVYSLTYQFDTSINDISSLTLPEFSTSSGNLERPTVRANGVEAGDSVFLFLTSNCLESSQVGFNKSTGTHVDIKVASGNFTTETSYQIYAKSSDDAGNQSSCIGTALTYVYDITAPTKPSSISVNDSSDPNRPVISVGGLTVGDTVKVYGEASCSQLLGEKVVASATELVTLNEITQDGLYVLHAKSMDPALNESDCSTVSVNYTLNQFPPTLSTVNLSSGGGKTNVGLGGDVILTFVASEALKTTTVTIEGNTVTANNTSGTTYQAVYTITGGDADGAVNFSIDYTDFADVAGVNVSTTSDSSALVIDTASASPDITVANQNVNENVLLNFDVNDGGNDQDGDGNNLSYSCYYDSTVDSAVSNSKLCDSLSGLSFSVSTGILNWTPSYSASGVYEFKVIATNGSLSDESIFTVTVNNVNRNPNITEFADYSLVQDKLLTLDVSDVSTGFDTDVDGDALTYTCEYDDVVDEVISGGSNCSDITGVNFNEDSGLFSWTVKASNAGNYDIKITAIDGQGGSDSFFFAAEVLVDLSKLPQLAMVGSATTTYVASLGDNNEVTFKGSYLNTYNAGDTFTLTSTKGDLLECSGGCYAITPIEGTAAWSTKLYASTLLSTYMGRYSYAKVSIAAFDNAATISIKQLSGDLVVNQVVPSNDVVEFEVPFTVAETMWIESDFDVSAYVSTSGSPDTYDRDGRIITAPAKTGLAFVAAAGGTPTGISVTQDNTTFSVYRDDGTDFLNQNLDVTDFLIVSNAGVAQNAQGSAISFYADAPIVSTQHADGDGTNSSPSLSKNMLSTHFVAPMQGDYASFASFEPGNVFVIDENDTVITTMALARDPGANALSPYSASYNPNNGSLVTVDIEPGYRFVSTVPALGIFEVYSNDDETLMTGAKLPEWELASTDFADGGVLPYSTIGSNGGSCTGPNNFPNLTWGRKPWGAKSFAVVVENVDNGDVHLNLVDIAASTTSIGPLTASSGTVTFPSGTVGNNYTGNATWTGPCLAVNQTYKFTAFALKSVIGSQVDNLSSATFASTYANEIMWTSSITGRMAFPD